MNEIISKARHHYDIAIAASLCAILILSIIIGQNAFILFGYTFSAGIFIFSFTYIFIATSTELYGIQRTRSIILITSMCNIIMAATCIICSKIHFAISFVGDSAFYNLYLNRLAYFLLISTCSYIISEYANSAILSKLILLTKGKMLIRRAIFSTLCGVILDTWLVFPVTYILFVSGYKKISTALIETFITMLFKIVYDLALMPIFWLLVEYVRYKEKQSHLNMLPECALPFTSTNYLQFNHERRG